MTEDEPVRPTVKFGEFDLEVRDPREVQPVMCEVITELRHMGPIFAISLASLVKNGDVIAHAQVVARLRIPIETLADIQRFVEAAMAEEAAAKQQAN